MHVLVFTDANLFFLVLLAIGLLAFAAIGGFIAGESYAARTAQQTAIEDEPLRTNERSAA